MNTADGRSRKEREGKRKEEELTRELEKEDERLQAEAAVEERNKQESSMPQVIEPEVIELDSREAHPSTPLRDSRDIQDDIMSEEGAFENGAAQSDVAMRSGNLKRKRH